MSDEALTDAEKTRFTLALVEQCVRNTFLEELHAGTVPDSAVGDYSDVKVVTPFGEIPWTQLAYLGRGDEDADDRDHQQGVHILTYADDLAALGGAARWNRPRSTWALSARLCGGKLCAWEHPTVLREPTDRRIRLRAIRYWDGPR
jgi:hypothetical protein